MGENDNHLEGEDTHMIIVISCFSIASFQCIFVQFLSSFYHSLQKKDLTAPQPFDGNPYARSH